MQCLTALLAIRVACNCGLSTRNRWTFWLCRLERVETCRKCNRRPWEGYPAKKTPDQRSRNLNFLSETNCISWTWQPRDFEKQLRTAVSAFLHTMEEEGRDEEPWHNSTAHKVFPGRSLVCTQLISGQAVKFCLAILVLLGHRPK